MIIHCDGCGAEIEKDLAFMVPIEAGETAWFCTEACLERCRHFTPVELPDATDRGAGSAVPVDEDADTRPRDPLS